MAMYGLEVPPGDIAMMAHGDIPAAFRVTMAAIDPSVEPEGDEDEIARPRATLKVVRLSPGDESDSEDEMDVDEMDDRFGNIEDLVDDDDESSGDDEDVTGGPSDPARSKQAKRAAAQKEIEKLLADEDMSLDSDDEDDDEGDDKPNGVNGVVKSSRAKGKMPASIEDSDEEDSDLDDESRNSLSARSTQTRCVRSLHDLQLPY